MDETGNWTKKLMWGFGAGVLCSIAWSHFSTWDRIIFPDQKPEFRVAELNLASNFILATQEYADACTEHDDAGKFKFEQATFEWTQVFGFGVDLEKNPLKLTHDGEGNYLVNLPKLEQLYPIEKGFSYISFPIPISMEVRDAFFTSEIDGKKIMKRWNNAMSVLEGRKLEGFSWNNSMKYFTMPTSIELRNLMESARATADARTELMSQIILTQDAALKAGHQVELSDTGSLSKMAGAKFIEALQPFFETMLAAQMEEEENLYLNGARVKSFKSLTVEFQSHEQPKEPVEYVSLGNC